MTLLLLSISICLLSTALLLRSASYGWYISIFALIVGADLFDLLPSPASDAMFYDLASDVCILVFALLMYVSTSSQEKNARNTDSNPGQSLEGRFSAAFVLAAYGSTLGLTSIVVGEPTQVFNDAREVTLLLFKSYMSILGFFLLWRTWHLRKAQLSGKA